MRHSAQIKTEVEITLTLTQDEFKELLSAVTEGYHRATYSSQYSKAFPYRGIHDSLRQVEADIRRKAYDQFPARYIQV